MSDTNDKIQVAEDVAAESPVSLIKMAVQNGAPIETLEKLLALEEKWRASRAKELYSQDYVKVKPLLPRVLRSKSNQQTKSKYAPLEDINKEVDPILSQYGFATATKIKEQNAEFVTIEAELWHRAGHVERTAITLPMDDRGMQGTVNKTMIHAISSTVTYGKRIAVCALLNISTGDDTDGQKVAEGGKPAKPELPDDVAFNINLCETNEQLKAMWTQYPKERFPDYHANNLLQNKLTEVRTRIYEGYKKKILEGLDKYTGEDKLTLRNECVAKAKSGAFDEKFAMDVAKKIGISLP